jgi:hypothetical protein
MYYGDQQAAVVNTPYGQRFAVFARHADGTPAPNAAVVFVASDGAFTGYAGTGGPVGFGIVTTSGAVVAPEYIAGALAGPGEVHALLLDTNAPEVLFHFINSAAGVASLEMLPGSVPQSARITAFYPNPIGTIVRDAAGNPVRDAVVTYEILGRVTGGYGHFTSDRGSSLWTRVITGDDGRAVPDRVTAFAPGTVDITATVPGAAQAVHFALEALPGGATRFELAGGENQRAIVGTTYAQPLSVRALGDDGLTVPNAAVFFAANSPATSPSVTFAGNNVRVVMADAGGVATSPPMTANDVVGFGFGSIFGMSTPEGQAGPFANFHFENVSSLLDVSFVGANPGNAPVGGTTWAPFHALVSNKLGAPVAGVPFRFEADSTCGAFLGQASYTGTTDAGGIATSALFQATTQRLACDVGFAAQGSTYGVGVSVHNFAPAAIVLTATPSPLKMSTLTSQGLQRRNRGRRPAGLLPGDDRCHAGQCGRERERRFAGAAAGERGRERRPHGQLESRLLQRRGDHRPGPARGGRRPSARSRAAARLAGAPQCHVRADRAARALAQRVAGRVQQPQPHQARQEHDGLEGRGVG